LSLGRLVQQQGRLDEARALFSGLLDGAEAPEALFQLARVARQQGDAKEAIGFLERLVDRYPDHALAEEALGTLAETRLRTGGCREALPWYERLLEEHAGSGWAVAARAAVERCSEEEPKVDRR
jgi:tetratricopeptide (TPR) repeat protein